MKELLKEIEFYKDTSKIGSNGIPIDIPYFTKMEEIRKSLVKRSEDYFKETGVNPRSHKQVKEFVVEEAGEKALEIFVNDKGKLSFDSNSIRRAQRIVSSKNEKLSKFLTRKTVLVPTILNKVQSILHRTYHGRIYDLFVHYGTVTGRPTSYKVNILNMPSGCYDPDVMKPSVFDDMPLEEAVPKLKKAFRGGIGNVPGKLIAVADLRQIEPRLLAWGIENKETLTALTTMGTSIYANIAQELFGDDGHLVESYVKRAGMAFLYRASFETLTKTLEQAYSELGKEPDHEKIQLVFDRLRKTWAGIDLFRSKFFSKFLSAQDNNRRNCVVLVDDVLGDFRLIKDQQTNEVICSYRETMIRKELMRYDFVSRVNQKRAGYVHKYLRNKILKAGYKVILDVYDEIVVEIDRDDVEKYKEKYHELFTQTKKELGLDFLDYNLSFDKRYFK